MVTIQNSDGDITVCDVDDGDSREVYGDSSEAGTTENVMGTVVMLLMVVMR